MSNKIINIIVSLIAGFLIGLAVMFIHTDKVATNSAEEYCKKAFEELRYDLIDDTAEVLSDDVHSEVTYQVEDQIGSLGSHLEEKLTELIYDELNN